MTSTKQNFLTIIEANPHLCSWGMVLHPWTAKRNRVDFAASRAELAAEFNAFLICCEYLALCRGRATRNYRVGTSYALKHRVEEWAQEYIPHGASLAALLFMGFPCFPRQDSPDVLVGISSRLPQGTKGQAA